MTNYKIKIYCTSKAELLLNNYPINNDSKQDINNCLQPDDDDRINEMCILYKQQKKDKRQKNIDNINYTIKCLEIFCNTLFSKSDFISYIKYMHETGFTSIKNNIYFIDNQSN